MEAIRVLGDMLVDKCIDLEAALLKNENLVNQEQLQKMIIAIKNIGLKMRRE